MIAARLYFGDCRDALRLLPADSLDSCVCDPPYALNFMGKWWDTGDVAFSVPFWKDVYRVLKPGAHLVAFSATRTYHRMASAVEDAGFEIRDQLAWTYGTGFPKSLNVSKAIDKAAGAERPVIGQYIAPDGNARGLDRGICGGNYANGRADYIAEKLVTGAATPDAKKWDGWGTALKPAWEPIVLARKPLSENTVVANVLKHGAGAINIDACRVGFASDADLKASTRTGEYGETSPGVVGFNKTKMRTETNNLGRFPANIVHDGSDEVLEAFPVTTSGKAGANGHLRKDSLHDTAAGWGMRHASNAGQLYGDSGSAARFFYSAKASKADRTDSKHPTIKPVALMQWLVRMVTPKEGTTIDPFAGSGSTGAACVAESVNVILCEREAEYVEDIKGRFAGLSVPLDVVTAAPIAPAQEPTPPPAPKPDPVPEPPAPPAPEPEPPPQEPDPAPEPVTDECEEFVPPPEPEPFAYHSQGALIDMPEQYKKLDPELVESMWRAPDPSTWPRFSEAARIGVDTEFRDKELTTLGVGCRRDPATHYVFGISLAIEDGPKMYFPFRHAGGDNLDPEQVLGYFRHEFKNFKGDLVGANLQCDLDWLWSMDMAMPQVHRFYDVQVADPLIYELEMSYSLDSISRRRGLGGKNEAGLRAAAARYGVDPKTDMWRLAGRHVGPYAEDDGALPLRILRKQEREMEEQGLMKVWDMESRLLPLLLRMTRKGVRVNLDRVDAMEKWARQREADAWAIVKRETAVDIPVGQSMNVTLLAKALRAAGLENLIGQNTRGDSINKDVLFEDAKHPVVAAIMDARKMAKVQSTYVNGTRKAIVHHGGGDYRVHTTFNQIRKTDEGKDGEDGKTKGVAYGRLSSSNPNMQNQPAADRQTGENLMGCMWRSVYQPEDGEIWAANDLKQQEPKWSFHYGAMLERATDVDGKKLFPDIKGAEDLCRRLRENPMLDTYEPLVEMTGKKRSVCKIMWLARAYGKGNGNMCEDLGYPTEDWVFVPRKMRSVPVASEDGQRALQMPGHVVFKGASPEGLKVIEDFDASMPFLKASAKLAETRAKDKGYVTLRSGRRCHFERDASGEYMFAHKAFNRLIQGTSAEQMKDDMLAVDAAGYGDMLMLQVHDEVDASVPSEKVAKDIAEVMKYAVEMEVPTVVDTECGPSWGESMSTEELIDGKKVKRPYRWHLN